VKRLVVLVALLLFAVPAHPFGQNKIVYDTFKWSVYHSTHFDVYFYEEERPQLQRVVDAAESAYLDLSQKFNYQISKKIPLIFYHTHSAFEQTNVILNFIPEGVGAFAEPAKNRMVLPIDMPDDQLLELVTHELTHIFEYEILFQGKFGKNITANPPQWMMEGLASFMAQDEDSRDRMVLRDAVVNDNIPAVSNGAAGYFAYRFGHSVFRYMQETYGWEGLRDFIYEYRNTLGNSIDRALRRAFNVSPDEFDSRFRTWLRKQYLPALVAKGEPQEYGEPFRIRVQGGPGSNEISAVPSPSGDLLAAFTTYKEDIDLVLFNIPERRLLKNLTSGYTSEYEYAIVQSFTTAPVMGRDVAWAPNGDQIALFVKKERGRNLLLLNPISGKIDRMIDMPLEQQLSPAYSPDGRRVAFSAIQGNQSDIFIYDLESGNITNVTSDTFYDSSPVFAPDGQSLIYSSVGEEYAKLYRVNLANTTERYQLTTGDWNDIDAYFSPDGKRLFFASDKQTGRNVETASKILEDAENAARTEGNTPKADMTNFAAFNIYSLDLTTGDMLQYTDVIGGCFAPVVFTGANNKERMVFSSYYKGQWRLYSTTTDKPLHAAEKTTLPSAPILAADRSVFRSTSEFFIDEDKIESTGGFKLFVDDIDVAAGVTSDQLLLSRSTLYMSDMLGNRRFIASLDSVDTFSNFDFLYLDLHRRWNWGARLFDNRAFYTLPREFETRGLERRQAYRETGAFGIVSYPFSRYHRLDAGAGYMARSYTFLDFQSGDQNGNGIIDFEDADVFELNHNFPIVSTTFSGDSAVWKFFGPVSGRRYQLSAAYAPDMDAGGTLTSDVTLDWREYKQISSRTLFAARLYGAWSEGNFPSYHYFGGLNTLRGFDFRSFVGQYAGFANLEFRFPLVDVLATPIMVIQQMRGVLFVDVGATHFKDQQFQFRNDEGFFEDGAASIGWGFSFNLLGLPLNWDFAKRFNGKELEKGFRTSFWVGQTF
jgi:Tol biopolymer transport system component